MLSLGFADLVCEGVRLQLAGQDVLVDLPCSGASGLLLVASLWAFLNVIYRPRLHGALVGGVLVVLLTMVVANTGDIAGRVIARADGATFDLPLLDSSISVNIEGDMATVELRQTFSNPSRLPLEAEYLFPLNQNAAVYGMVMKFGDEVIEAVIREKEQAQADFDEAASEGRGRGGSLTM